MEHNKKDYRKILSFYINADKKLREFLAFLRNGAIFTHEMQEQYKKIDIKYQVLSYE